MKFDILRATELAAIAASKHIGNGNKILVDQVALDAMRNVLNDTDFLGRIVLSEGIKDSAPNFGKNELVGKKRLEVTSSTGSIAESINKLYCYDILADVVDGTTQTTIGGYEAASLLVMGEQDAFLTSDSFYMVKMACGPDIAACQPSINDNLDRTMYLASKATHKKIGELVICVLNRPRHLKLIQELRSIGVRIKLIQDCDVLTAISTCISGSNIDMMLGAGGVPEGLISAAAIKAFNGSFQCYMCDKDGNPTSKIYYTYDLVKGPILFAATGILPGVLLRGVTNVCGGYSTHSLVIDSQQSSLQRIETFHKVN